jgi:putative addiction module component (TIGR02574 family)
MAKAVEEIERDFLALNERDRASLLGQLIGHLDDPHDTGIEKAWLDEAERRLAEIDAGTAKTHPAEGVFREIRARLK